MSGSHIFLLFFWGITDDSWLCIYSIKSFWRQHLLFSNKVPHAKRQGHWIVLPIWIQMALCKVLSLSAFLQCENGAGFSFSLYARRLCIFLFYFSPSSLFTVFPSYLDVSLLSCPWHRSLQHHQGLSSWRGASFMRILQLADERPCQTPFIALA